MDLSIIILNYKTRGLTKYCVKGIQGLKLPFDYEIIVIDNGSKDGTPEMIKEEFIPQGSIKLIVSPENVGYAAGNNLGIREAKGRYIMVLNADIAVLEGSIEALYDFMERNPRVAIAGPKLINPDGTVQMSCYRFPGYLIPLYRRTVLGKLPFAQKTLKNYLMEDWDHSSNRTVDWLLGACHIVRREAMEKVGLMDERFFLYFDDVDWCRRFWQAGHEVYYIADAKMVHYHKRQSAENSLFRAFLNPATRAHIISGIKYFNKYRGVKLDKSQGRLF